MSTHWVELGIGAGGFAAVATPLLGVAGRHLGRTFKATAHEVARIAVEAATKAMTERIDKSDEKTEAVRKALESKIDDLATRQAATDVQMAQQFGGNSNGLRQAVDAIGQKLSNLDGRFVQHITESGKS